MIDLKNFFRNFFWSLKGRPSVPRERRRLSDLAMAHFDATVEYGALKGYKIPLSSHWGGLARPAMLLGLYEKEVVEVLKKFAHKRGTFIDVGAADGFFAVGLVASGIYKFSHAFEITAKGREVIKISSEINEVTDRVAIHGIFDADTLKNKHSINFRDSVVLIDIEGDEFSLLEDSVIRLIRDAVVVVELHDFLFEDGDEQKRALIARLAENFDVTTITTGARSLPRCEFLDKMSDNERWLLCSEGRARRMEWLIASPHVLAKSD